MTNEEIKALRKSTGLTQEQFAHLVGVTTHTVSKWEKTVKPAQPHKFAIEKLEKIKAQHGKH